MGKRIRGIGDVQILVSFDITILFVAIEFYHPDAY